MALFEDRLTFRFEFSDGAVPARIVNTKPQQGESAVYQTEGRNGGSRRASRRAFARIALVPNLNHTGRVLLLSGTTIEATEAAAEFFLDERAAETLKATLGSHPSEGTGFEVLLETSSIGGTARNARVIGPSPPAIRDCKVNDFTCDSPRIYR